MTAAILPFQRQKEGGFDRSPFQQRADDRLIREARLIVAAKRDRDDWTGRLLLALLPTLDPLQQARISVALATCADSEPAQQALALVHLATASKEERQRIRAVLDRLEGPEVAL